MEREKLRKLKCSFFSTLTYFKGLKTSSHISKIPQSMALIKKEFLKKRRNGRFLCAYIPTFSWCWEWFFSSIFISKNLATLRQIWTKKNYVEQTLHMVGKLVHDTCSSKHNRDLLDSRCPCYYRLLLLHPFFPSNMYELNPGILFTESFIKTVWHIRRKEGEDKERKQKHLSRYFPEKNPRKLMLFCLENIYIPLVRIMRGVFGKSMNT